MFKSVFVPGALALALSIAPRAWGATDADLEAIRKEIQDLKSSYEGRIRALEQRLKDAEAKPTQAPAPVVAAPSRTAATSSISAFNPAISVVLQGTYANLSRDPEQFAIAGFAPGGEIGPGRRGFSLAESELQLSANVDDKFAGNLIVALSPDNTVSVEEAYAIFMGAPFGVTPKFGRFFSGIGYLNEQHQHAWDFVDAPLAYQAFLGGQYANDGIQLKWLAPLEHFVEFGAEAGNGDSFPGGPRNKNGIGSGALFVHTGGDIGTSHSWRAGLSYLRTRTDDRAYEQADLAGNAVPVGFGGTSRVAMADFVWKWAPNGNFRQTNFKVQGEYFQRRERGDFTYDLDGALGLTNVSAYAARQSGWYVQGVYQFMPTWRAGVRYDRLSPGSVDYGSNAAYLETAAFKPERVSAMLDWSPSEFSRIRLQFAQSKAQPDVTDNQWFLQYILSLGAHGAHKY